VDDEQMARRILRETLTASDATPADRVRAAQLLLAHGNEPGVQGDALAADDAELLAIARGEYTPREGPKAPGNFSVPSEARQEQLAVGGVPDDLGRVPAAFLVRGPKKSPPNSPTPGGPKRMGPKKGRSNLTSRGAGAKKGPEPWE
jgi:hypothetical protein